MYVNAYLLLKLWAKDVSAQKTMKDAAKCDKHCEWQNLANLWNSERILQARARSSLRLVQGVFTFMLQASWWIVIATFLWVCIAFLCVSVILVADSSDDAIDTLNLEACYAWLHSSGEKFSNFMLTISCEAATGLIQFHQSYFAWTQARLGTEFKHISKCTKRKWTWFPQ